MRDTRSSVATERHWCNVAAQYGLLGSPDVAVDDIWQAWNANGINAAELIEKFGWPAEQVRTMDHYRGSMARYSFMRFDEAICHLQSAGFDLVTTRAGHYEFAERCPRVLLKKRRGNSDARSP